MEYTLYLRNAVYITEEQTNNFDDDNIVTGFGKQEKFSHPFSAKIGIHGCTAVQNELKSCKDPDVY